MSSPSGVRNGSPATHAFRCRGNVSIPRYTFWVRFSKFLPWIKTLSSRRDSAGRRSLRRSRGHSRSL